MKLNPDLVRNILLTVEDVTDFNNLMFYEGVPNKFSRLKNYTHDETIYHISQCSKSELIEVSTYADNGTYVKINDLTPKGHEFLANIRADNLWNDTKNVASKIGSYSLDTLTKIATGVIVQLINHQLGLN